MTETFQEERYYLFAIFQQVGENCLLDHPKKKDGIPVFSTRRQNT
jgi:hypothetical protein